MWSLKPAFRYKQCFVFKNRDFSLQEEAFANWNIQVWDPDVSFLSFLINTH